MATVNEFTNNELRRELIYYGETPGPVTASTRQLYIKKLKKLKLDEVTSKRNQSHSSMSTTKPTRKSSIKLHGFSSDESDHEENHLQKKAYSTRTSKQRKSSRISASHENYLSSKLSGSKISPPKIINGYSDDSDDDSNSSWVQVTSAVTNTSPTLFTLNSSDSFDARHFSLQSRFQNPSNASINTNSSDQSDNRHHSTGFSFSINESHEHKSEPSQSSTTKEIKNGGDMLRRRALHHALQNNDIKTCKVSSTNKCKNDPNIDEDNFNESILSKSWKALKPLNSHPLNSSNLSKSPPRLWPLRCAILIPISIVGFFFILGLLYITMRNDDVVTSPRLLESLSNPKDEKSLMAAVNSIYEMLAERTGNVLCKVTNASTLLSATLVMSNLKLEHQTFYEALKLIREHEEWKIFLYLDDGGTLIHGNASISEVKYLETTVPSFPTYCRFERAIYKVLSRVLVVIAVCLILWMLLLYRRHRMAAYDKERQEMFVMVEKILEVLRKNYESSLDDDSIKPFIPIIIIRDMLIPPRDRNKKLKVWEMAVRFISASESRIRVETQRVLGEDYRVWRWIQVTSPAKQKQAPNRIWQGVAFDANSSVNTPNISPTPCLKIRNMFDPAVEKDVDWDVQVQDSILEKCSDAGEILSIVVERNSPEGLVYVKCGSCAAAGRVFRSLHGAWFDGRLVTVKFIRLNRFHARYPNTVDLKTPMKPSSPVPVSTTAPSQDPNIDFATSTPLK